MNVVKKSKREFIILTEGYMDAIALHQYGFDCAVASLGTSLTQEHADMLSKYTDELVLTYDATKPGRTPPSAPSPCWSGRACGCASCGCAAQRTRMNS